jgi:hypothetical protein
MWSPSSHLVYQTLFGQDTCALKIEDDDSHNNSNNSAAPSSVALSIASPAFTRAFSAPVATDEEFGRAIMRKSSPTMIEDSEMTSEPNTTFSNSSNNSGSVAKKRGRPTRKLSAIQSVELVDSAKAISPDIGDDNNNDKNNSSGRKKRGRPARNKSDNVNAKNLDEMDVEEEVKSTNFNTYRSEMMKCENDFASVEKQALMKLRILSMQYRKSMESTVEGIQPSFFFFFFF